MQQRANRWGGNLANRKERLQQQITAKRDNKVMLEILKAALQPGDGQSATAQAAAYLTDPHVQRNSLVDSRVTMPLEEFTRELAENAALGKLVSEWLRETPLPEDSSTSTLKMLVTRLLICDAVRDSEQAAHTAAAITHWVHTHEPPPAAPGVPAKPPEPAAAADKPKKPASKVLPDELLLGMAALRMPQDKIDRVQIAAMLERAIVAAESSGEPALKSSLECQFARNIASTQPERAKKMFQKALDGLLPADDAQGAAAPKEGT
jgi:hypothetical protein